MSYIQNYQDHSPLSDREVQDVVAHSQRSIHKTITRPDGKKEYILSTKAMLDSNGKPIPIDEFMVRSGQRVMKAPHNSSFVSADEALAIKVAKKQWKKDNPGHISTKAYKSLKQLKIALETSAILN